MNCGTVLDNDVWAADAARRNPLLGDTSASSEGVSGQRTDACAHNTSLYSFMSGTRVTVDRNSHEKFLLPSIYFSNSTLGIQKVTGLTGVPFYVASMPLTHRCRALSHYSSKNLQSHVQVFSLAMPRPRLEWSCYAPHTLRWKDTLVDDTTTARTG